MVPGADALKERLDNALHRVAQDLPIPYVNYRPLLDYVKGNLKSTYIRGVLICRMPPVTMIVTTRL